MKYHLKSHQGSALIVGLIIVVLLTIMTVSFLEKVLGLGRVSGGISNSAQAYALTTGLIEERLIDPNMTKQAPWQIPTKIEGNSNQAGNSTGRTLLAYTGGNILPMPKKWNSQYDDSWNIIGMGQPVQIVIPSGVTWGSVNFQFRVPAIPWVTNTGASATFTNSWIILWTFGYSGASLYASGETNIFKLNDINGGTIAKYLMSYYGLTNTGVSMQFGTFYSANESNCGTSYQCTLKLSMIRPFITAGWQSFPFLEYQIIFNTTIPAQYMILDSSAFVRGYLRSRQVRIPQITTNTATDFAVLQ
jgi:hypothetical protein